MTTAFDKLTKAKSRLVTNQPFFAHIVLSLPLVEDNSIPTMATDMQRVYYNDAFVEKHSVTELQGVLAHEAMHVAYLHGMRKAHRDHTLWNIACDFCINPIILDAGLTLPTDALYDEKYKGMSAQEIYELIKSSATKINVSFSGDPDGDDKDKDGKTPMWGGVMKAEKEMPDGSKQPLSADEMSTLEQEIRIKVQQASEQAKSRGKMPGGLEGLIKAIGAPKVNWQDYIQSWIKGITPDNYTWQRPNRTMMAVHHVYMPRMQLNGAGVGVLSIDTSGSVSDKELVEYITEIAGIIEMTKPDKLYIVQHDAVIQRVDIWEAGMSFEDLKVKGRGGTCIMPTFRYLKEIDEEVNWCICFTDCGIGDYPRNPEDIPDYPVLWAATGPDNTPFGQYIPIYDQMARA